jgi:hypothetical protein
LEDSDDGPGNRADQAAPLWQAAVAVFAEGINGIGSHQRESTFLMQPSCQAAQGRPVQIWTSLNKKGPDRHARPSHGYATLGTTRHILVDTLGLLLSVVVHPADVQDRDGAFLCCAGRDDLSRPPRDDPYLLRRLAEMRGSVTVFL